MISKNKGLLSLLLILSPLTLLMAQNSPHGVLAIECTACHVTSSWTEMRNPLEFDHSTTAFPLNGRHAITTCKLCHTTLKFSGTVTDCFTCHREDFERIRMPDHLRGQFSHDCTPCHSFNGWMPSIFDHQKTNFQLIGAHLAVDCYSCHQNARFAGIASDCFSCHRTDFAAALSPNHQTSQFSHDCTSCHSMNGWTPSTFDHSKTVFPLQGAHRTIDCVSCHSNSRFAGTPTDCYTCHQADFAGAKAPDHLASQLSHDCTTCHSSFSWSPSTFDHSKTSFPLLGAHRLVACIGCHAGGKFAGTQTTCYACHQADFASAPSHLASQYSHDCLTCHTMDAWSLAGFDHNKTSFPLTGAHQTLQCSSCHKNGQFAALATDCYSCHVTDFNNVQTPNHQLGQFSHDCTTCHTTVAWKPSTFNHSSTVFPLTGAHLTTDCRFCHKNGRFQGLSTDCFSCHQTDFNNVTDPNHVSGNFDHNCVSCHSTTAWMPATFDHSKTSFVLTGAHIQATCASCHINNRFAGTPTDCYSCHINDYNSATNPNHASAKYPVTCANCHSTTAWQPSTFDHTPFFPIGSGSVHSPGRWTFCSDCHTNQSNPATFECINCHTHSKSETDSNHKRVSGYVYASTACYKCHPQGR